MVNELAFSDTFSEWKDKINALIAEHISFGNITLGITGPFAYNRLTSTGLNVVIFGGRVRNGSIVETMVDTVVALPPNTTRVLAIYKIDDVAPVLRLYVPTELPERNVIPIAIFTTNGLTFTAYTDLRTEFVMASGSAASASSILKFDKNVDINTTVQSTKNALSIDPIVNDGITVTIEDGAVWVVL